MAPKYTTVATLIRKTKEYGCLRKAIDIDNLISIPWYCSRAAAGSVFVVEVPEKANL